MPEETMTPARPLVETLPIKVLNLMASYGGHPRSMKIKPVILSEAKDLVFDPGSG